jgi:hypothetical protein
MNNLFILFKPSDSPLFGFRCQYYYFRNAPTDFIGYQSLCFTTLHRTIVKQYRSNCFPQLFVNHFSLQLNSMHFDQINYFCLSISFKAQMSLLIDLSYFHLQAKIFIIQ